MFTLTFRSKLLCAYVQPHRTWFSHSLLYIFYFNDTHFHFLLHETFLDCNNWSQSLNLWAPYPYSSHFFGVFNKRQKPRMCRHDNWSFCWIMGCCQLQQQGKIYLQETSRGCTCDNSSTHHRCPELCIRVDPCQPKERLLQSMRTNWTNLWNLCNVKYLKLNNFFFVTH